MAGVMLGSLIKFFLTGFWMLIKVIRKPYMVFRLVAARRVCAVRFNTLLGLRLQSS